MNLESRPGHGSTFRVIVPLARQWDGEEPAPPQPALAGVRALVVDDNPTSLSLLEWHLEAWGSRVESLPDGASALARMAAAARGGAPFDVAVVDSRMPAMDGLELAARISATPDLASTPILLLTTGRPLDSATARRLGVVASVAKPVVPRELYDALVQVVTSSGGGDESPAAPDSAGPGQENTPAGPSAARVTSPQPRSRGRVLVVEDNLTNQMVAMGLLTRLGFDPEVVGNGQEAVDAVRAREFAVVLMDCNMPVMDGFEATAAIRHDEGGDRHLPIVAMTAGALVGDRERCLAAGMDDYVSKPVKLSELDRVLSRWRPAAQPTAWVDVIDGDQLESLRALDGGDGTFLSTLVDSFLTSSSEALATLAAAAEAGDAETLRAEAHRLKGEASTLGASGVAALCGQLEKLPAPFDRAAATDLVGRAGREMERVREILRDALGGAQIS